MTSTIALGIALVVIAIGNILTAYANYRTHNHLVRALELQQNFNNAVVDLQRSTYEYLNLTRKQ